MQNLYCAMAVCVWTLVFLKVSIRVYALCMEHIACHLGHFTPLRVATDSICTWSLYYFFRRLCVHCIAHGTLEILQLCHLGICMYTMETRTGLIEYAYTLHQDEGYNYIYMSSSAIPSTRCLRQKLAVAEDS